MGYTPGGARWPGAALAASNELRDRFHEAIPGGAHTYAKGDDQWPDGLAPYIVRGRGCRVWDVDGNEYLEFGMGLRSVTLGHAHPRVDAAVQEATGRGQNFVRPSVLELEAAERFLSLVPGSERVKFTKNGSDATTAALKLARAHTGRDMVALCTDHPFFSVDDWFIGTTAVNSGIPDEIIRLSVGYRYGDLADLARVFAEHPDRIALVVLEPARVAEPPVGYLEGVVDLAHEHGALVLFDEMITGFRWGLPGAQAVYGVTPDLTSWGKGIANGYALSALSGRADVMDLGGLRQTDHDRVFLLSTTHGAESVGLAAAMATWSTYEEEDVVDRLHRTGRLLRDGITDLVDRHGVDGRFTVFGRDCCLFYGTNDADGVPSQAFRTLFLQETVSRGLLAPSLVTSLAHDDASVSLTLEIVDAALGVYAKALEGPVEAFLKGRPVAPVYRRRN